MRAKNLPRLPRDVDRDALRLAEEYVPGVTPFVHVATREGPGTRATLKGMLFSHIVSREYLFSDGTVWEIRGEAVAR